MKIEYDDDNLKINNGLKIIFYHDFLKIRKNMNELITKMKTGSFYSDLDIVIEEVITIESNIDWKKELTLMKTSELRKQVNEKLQVYIDKQKIDLNFDLEENENLLKIKDFLDHQFVTDEWKLEFEIRDHNAKTMIDDLFEIKITNNQNVLISEYSPEVTKNIYLNIILNKRLKNRLIIVENYDEYIFDKGNLWLDNYLELAKNNIVILTTRNHYFFKNKNISLDQISFLLNDEIIDLETSTSIIKNYLLTKDFKGEMINIETMLSYSDLLIEEENIKDIEQIVKQILVSILNFDEFYNLNFYEDNLGFMMYSFLKLNKKIFSNKVQYETKSEITKYLFKKYLQ